ncbi:DUF4932 domain-containing protein [Chryseobacterium sp. Ch-15]|uniref:DUF4932 domain-containing protein n=1 Tax=Chryseobacterium muglaense TaxID=2893752 RepID=A0A9Q3UY49_9FLAO|nr:DUF4932 domain-containing protein [Chryseobacterium muglaense]MBD3906288.1 DUF4932 domain-containing protein [Chryseobacterium muglaense]MCC9036737.1 DUF4932 domain-containing protein [Chryseobacterium muglaense]MCM2555310.1 DUF4932 domain-containing protein [Chryseobacterium muglaense]
MILIKKLWMVSIPLVSILNFSQEKLTPKVDERVEVVSIVFRLAGAEEYSQDYNKKYVEDINTYFTTYKNSGIVEFIKENRNKNGLGKDAVMSMALHLSLKNGKFSPIKEKVNSLDKRWEKVDKKQFVSLLNLFYKNTNFQQFFNNHSEDYKKAISEYQKIILSDFNQDWYSRFYGKKATEDYKIILGYGNGGGNYGIKTHPEKQQEIVNAVVGMSSFDKDGNARFDKNEFQPLLIHEFNHSFINYILEMGDNKSKLENSGKIIYELVKEDMEPQAYTNWEIMINESLVRASVVRYMIDNQYSQKEIDEEVSIQEKRKFLWIKELVELLGKYENDRKKYSSFESFYPEIISFYNQLAPKMSTIISNYEKNQPKVISISPDIWNKNDVDPSIKEITINFDREMAEGNSINMGDSGKEHFPLTKNEGFVNNHKGIKLLMELKPNTEYEFILTNNKFKSKEGYPLKEAVIKFKTK